MIMPESASIGNLLDYFSFAIWISYFMTFLSIIVMRYYGPMRDVKREFKVWLPLPIFCALIVKDSKNFPEVLSPKFSI